MTDFQPLDLLRLPLRGTSLIEASAGTGKTFTLAALYVRLVLGQGDNAFGKGETQGLTPQQLLVLTFTNAATQELRERIRQRLADSASLLKQASELAEQEANALDAFIAAIEDDFLRQLLAQTDDYAQAYRRAAQAANDMDQAAIYTLHGFCQRSLKRFAFAAGQAFEQQLEPDTAALTLEVQNDYWRRFIQPLPASLVKALLDQGIDCPASLAQAIKEAIKKAELSLSDDDSSELPAALLEQDAQLTAFYRLRDTARQALQEQQQELFDWLQQAVADKWLQKAQLSKTANNAFEQFIEKGKVEGALSNFSLSGLRWMKAAEQAGHEAPASLTCLSTMDELLSHHQSLGDLPLELLLQQSHDWIHHETERRLQDSNRITFDSMISRLAHALESENGQELADQLFHAYPCTLIDEFQDTDAHQYSIFRRVYAGRPDDAHAWLMIGDPKQSIYRFRGAELDVYDSASQAAQRHFTLERNFRSAGGMVAACNTLFGSSPLEQEDGGIFMRDSIRYRAVSAKGRDEQLLIDGQPASALTFCQPPWEDDKPAASGRATELLAEQFACRIARLLHSADAGNSGFQRPDGLTPLQPSDIACLVRNRKQADLLKAALSTQGIDATFLSDKSSVYKSDTAEELLVLLSALAQPQDGQLVRLALAQPLLGYEPQQLPQLLEASQWQQQLLAFRELKQVWQQQGVLAMLHRLVHRLGLPSRLRDERRLTDLFHLAELLQQASRQLDGIDAQLNYLQAAINGKHLNLRDDGSSDAQLRLENERNRVTIMTLHFSKGLEFPLVMLPFACLPQGKDKLDDMDEEMRLLYVGITRAVHGCWLGLMACRYGNANNHTLENSPLGRLLCGSPHVDESTLAERLARLSESHDISRDQRLLPADEADSAYQSGELSLDVINPQLPTPRQPAYWQVSSYSRLASHAAQGHFSAHSERLLEEAQPLTADTSQSGDSPHDFARGREAGNLLHGLLEAACQQGFQRLDAAQLDTLCERACRSQRWQDNQPLLRDWLEKLLHTPLPLGDLNASLAEADTALAESEFWLRLTQGSSAELDALAHRLLPGSRAPLRPQRLDGMLKGFIDLLFCVGERYYVLDYKSNWLGGNDDAYTSERMADAMLAHRYELQGLIYQLALHRLLRERLPNYDPACHLGGSLFFFLRGIDSDSRGLFHLAADPSLLDEAEQLFDSPEETEEALA